MGGSQMWMWMQRRDYLDLSTGGRLCSSLGAAACDADRNTRGSRVAGTEHGLEPEPAEPRARLAGGCRGDHIIFCFAGLGEASGRVEVMKVQRFRQHSVELVGTRRAGRSENAIGSERACCMRHKRSGGATVSRQGRGGKSTGRREGGKAARVQHGAVACWLHIARWVVGGWMCVCAGRGALAVTVRGNDDADAGCNVGAVISWND